MIHAVLRCFETLKTWFFDASKRSTPRKIKFHAMFRCFEALNTSQNTWFTLFCDASKHSKSYKMHDSRHVSMLRPVQNIAWKHIFYLISMKYYLKIGWIICCLLYIWVSPVLFLGSNCRPRQPQKTQESSQEAPEELPNLKRNGYVGTSKNRRGGNLAVLDNVGSQNGAQ